MKHVSVLELRKGLKVYVEEIQKSGEPTILVVHGKDAVAMVPAQWAEVLYQVAQFDKCDANLVAVKADMRQVFQRAFEEASAGPKLSLVELFKKIAEDATTVRQFHSLQESLK